MSLWAAFTSTRAHSWGSLFWCLFSPLDRICSCSGHKGPPSIPLSPKYIFQSSSWVVSHQPLPARNTFFPGLPQLLVFLIVPPPLQPFHFSLLWKRLAPNPSFKCWTTLSFERGPPCGHPLPPHCCLLVPYSTLIYCFIHSGNFTYQLTHFVFSSKTFSWL